MLPGGGPLQRPDRLHSSGLNAHFTGPAGSFAEYIASTRAMLAQVHTGADSRQRIDGNAPFELYPQLRDGLHKPYRRGILLTHGLSDSPYHMRHLAAFFQRQNFRVMAVLLPGHGTVPGDLLDASWQEWGKAVAYGTGLLAGEVDELYLGGFSAGGALSVRQSLLDERVRGLFLFAPALKISWRARLANLHKFYSWLVPGAKWLDVLPDRDLYKYESFARNAAAQTYALIADLQAKMHGHPVTVPSFAAASMEDTTVDTMATLRFIDTMPHPLNRLVLYTTDPAAAAEWPKVEAVNSVVLEQRILSSAHTAIVLPPDDGHYGIAGGYANCLHYYHADAESYEVCRTRPDSVWLGELTRQNLNVGILRRLMYNPNFAALQDSMRRFIETLPEQTD
ncbi:MAG: alpha/beta fold hydrolase [Sideroxydans sp.]|nr:alpha/beta fold hydrolase [Sideroxydans sp.]